MKTLRIFLFLTLCSFTISAEEFVKVEKSGKLKQHVAESRFYFDGEDCYAAKRSYSDRLMHVIIPKVYWDLYFEGELVATFGPAERDLSYVRVPSGHEFQKQLSRITISKDGEALRIWNLKDGEVVIYSDDDLKRHSEKKGTLKQDPNFVRLMASYRPRLKAPTKNEAEKDMNKSSTTKDR